MTLHYQGTPITPREILWTLAGKNFCVSYADPRDVEVCHKIGQSVMLDNGAYSIWKNNGKSPHEWTEYYDWCERWFSYQTTWAVIPDVIGGAEEENDALVYSWPLGKQGAPVWHLHESFDRLIRLCENHYRVCFGSSGEYKVIATPKWCERVSDAFDRISTARRLRNWIHMLRGMSLVGSNFPFASVDSTDVAQNWHVNGDAKARAERWDSYQCPGEWKRGMTQPSMKYPPLILAE